MPGSAWIAYCRKVYEARKAPVTQEDTIAYLMEKGQEEFDNALIEDWLSSLGYRIEWRIVPARDQELDELKEKGPGWLSL